MLKDMKKWAFFKLMIFSNTEAKLIESEKLKTLKEYKRRGLKILSSIGVKSYGKKLRVSFFF